jgi:hypothetical protein
MRDRVGEVPACIVTARDLRLGDFAQQGFRDLREPRRQAVHVAAVMRRVSAWLAPAAGARVMT